jgi:hypothetical protein
LQQRKPFDAQIEGGLSNVGSVLKCLIAFLMEVFWFRHGVVCFRFRVSAFITIWTSVPFILGFAIWVVVLHDGTTLEKQEMLN